MTDDKYRFLLEELMTITKTKNELLERAEEEYERRFDNSPSDVDDDNWIDLFHYGFSESFEFDDLMKKCKRVNERKR